MTRLTNPKSGLRRTFRPFRSSAIRRITRSAAATMKLSEWQRAITCVLLNNDVEVPRDWLTPLVNKMEADPSVGAVQPKLLQMDDRSQFEYSGAAGGHLDRFGYPFTRGRIFFTMEEDLQQYDSVAPIFWASGAAIVLRKSALDRVGLLDERFVLHMEEIDLCWRLQRFGYSIVAIPDSEVYHIGGASLPSTNPMKTYYNFRNGLLMLYKNLPPDQWLRIFPMRALLDLIAAMRPTLPGQRERHRCCLQGFLSRPQDEKALRQGAWPGRSRSTSRLSGKYYR